ncbi:class I tRNA ligase family protein, partial [Candidatus Parcubacteria bacterium]|nr:class I tRNA ligase family protein [Candidatus Parcubacteria bacterium]
MLELESTHRNKKILIVTHGSPISFLQGIALGLSEKEFNPLYNSLLPVTAEIRKLNWRKIPRNEIGELDLHRPFIDSVTIKCPQCKSKMKKIPDLIDVWFDSGSMPYAQWHYPFENKQVFKQQFPADFIVEAVDQTRGWFWTLLAISTLLGKGAPYKNVMVLGHTLDEKGLKMSKKLKNFVPVMELMDKYGADVLRWYFLSSVTIGESKSVVPKEIEEKLKGFTFTLQNCIRFYELYGAGQTELPAKLSLLDKW